MNAKDVEVASGQPPCPCCLFLANDDLFLPPSETPQDTTVTTTSSTHLQLFQEEESTEPIKPIDCWETLLQKHVKDELPVVVDTHGHAHLVRDPESIYQTPSSDRVMSLTCAVEPDDWDGCLKYAASSPWRMAALGVHPWYLSNLKDTWLSDLEILLQQHPGCMVGEIGLCKMARFLRTYEKGKQAALELQRQVFTQQLRLAAKYQRPVTVHCVNQQGVLLEILKENQDNLPPAIGLHSFTGTAHHVKKLLEWEQSLKLSEPLLYFGFSHTVNYAMSTSDKSRRQGKEAIRQVPTDRLLAESDVHHDANVAAGTAGAVGYLSWARGESIEAISELTRRNGLQFLRHLHIS